MDIHDVLEQYRPGSKRTLTVTLDGDVADRLEAAADKLDVTRHDFVRAALQLALGQAFDDVSGVNDGNRGSSRRASADASCDEDDGPPDSEADVADNDRPSTRRQSRQSAASQQARSDTGRRTGNRRAPRQRQEPQSADTSSESGPAPVAASDGADPPVTVDDIDFDDI